MHIGAGSHGRARRAVSALAVAAMTATVLVLTGAAGNAASGSTFTWHLDETSGSTMVDSTGGEDGTLHNVTLGRPGVSGTAYGFDGASSSVVVPNDDSLNAYDADVHIAFWMRTTSVPSKPDYDLFRKGQYPGSEYKLELQPNGQVSCEYKGVLADGSMASATLQGGPDLSDGQWHHIICDKTATAVTLTVDSQSWTRTKAVGSIYNNHDVVVGAYPNGDYYQGDLDEITLQIGPRTSTPGPTASFRASPTSGTVPLPVQFTDTSTGSPTSWSWDFGDGSPLSSAQDPSHTYTTPGTYTVRLTAANAQGSSTATATVKVAPAAPTAAFTATPASGAVPLAVQFEDASTGSPTSWSWSFGDGSPVSTQQDPSHTFAEPGTYDVTLTVANAAGTSTVTHPVTARDETAPKGLYTVSPTDAWAGATRVVLRQQSLSDDVTPADRIRRVVDWGDGSAPVDWTSGTRLGHVYRSTGRHVPTVTLTDAAGNRATVTLPAVTVSQDDVAPTVQLRVPAAAARVSSWRWLHGTVADAQSGVATVRIKAVERRGAHWYAYQPTSRTWVRVATRAAALRRAGWATVVPDGTAWSHHLPGLRRGTLVLRVSARDRAGNVAPLRRYRFLLTRP